MRTGMAIEREDAPDEAEETPAVLDTEAGDEIAEELADEHSGQGQSAGYDRRRWTTSTTTTSTAST